MSGNFTQRGEIAVLDKFKRAEHAIKAGADAVIELPTVFATANADTFAKGAINVISSLGVKGGLCFGIESGEKQEYIDLALPKVERQIIKYGDKFFTRLKKDSLNKDYLFFEEAPVIQKAEVVKKKTFELEPISVEDAKMFLDTIDNNFYIVLNRETNRVNVIYKRLDNNYGLIEAIY